MSRFLIDANSVIFALSGRYPMLRERLAACEPGEVSISAISFAEIELGAQFGRPPPAGLLDDFVSLVPILPFDENAARAYARLPFRRARFDRLLAAHALSLRATVVTNNLRDFSDVAGLAVEDWTV